MQTQGWQGDQIAPDVLQDLVDSLRSRSPGSRINARPAFPGRSPVAKEGFAPRSQWRGPRRNFTGFPSTALYL